jgi:hypothetical protein
MQQTHYTDEYSETIITSQIHFIIQIIYNIQFYLYMKS